jgi:fermentation-respiration switch protein FrsA (DUF1100 family)
LSARVHWLFLLLRAALVGYALVVAVLYLVQRRLLYFPDTRRPALGDLAPIGVREVTLRTEDGLSLLSWYLPSPDHAPVIVYFHGNGGYIGHRRERLQQFAAAGFGVLMAEYRGYGGNPGSPSETGLMADARAALALLDAQRIAPDRRVVYGESLGCGVAVQLAADHPIAALILESPYTSIADVAQYHYPFVPVRWLLHDRFDALSRIGAITAPSLFLQADRDPVIPARFGRALYAAAQEPKHLWSVASGGHEDVGRLGGIAAAVAFVRKQFGAWAVDHAAQ